LISHTAITSSLGNGVEATAHALRTRQSGLQPCRFDTADLDTYVGQVTNAERMPVPQALARFDCRNNRLALLGLAQDGFLDAMERAKAKYSPSRIGVFLGTSTSGILQTELAYRRRDPATGALPADFDYAGTHNTFSLGHFVRSYLGLAGPAFVVSTACSSSAKVFASAARMIEAGVCDAAVVGGVDSLCLTTLYGFASLGLVSAQPCRPFDVARAGISIGEAAGFALLEKPEASGRTGLMLLGTGESADAHHMSSPHPEGLGARLAMQRALQDAGLESTDIDYINLHGTASRSNDSAEEKAVADLFGTDTPASSTKGWTGHALGAAGIMEAVICAIALEQGFLPGSVHTRQLDPEFRLHYLLENSATQARTVMSNSFGFGGTNCSLVLGLKQ
jgi:3-oxoacyl-[acyl-carrier-protein] synthase-1